MSKDTTLFSGHGWAGLTHSGPGARAERKVWGWERVSPGQGWLGGLLGWFLIAAERFGLPVRRQKRTQEIRGLSVLLSQELLLHTDSFFYFCRSVWHFSAGQACIWEELSLHELLSCSPYITPRKHLLNDAPRLKLLQQSRVTPLICEMSAPITHLWL